MQSCDIYVNLCIKGGVVMDIVLSHNDILEALPDRDLCANKTDMGRLLLLCGSEGFTGAAALSAMGALRGGSGLVYLCVPRCIYQIEAIKLNEPIVLPLCDENGILSVKAKERIAELLPKMDAVLVGPGLGISENTEEIVRFVLETYAGPVVLDADGITLMCKHKNVLRDRIGQTVLTPHEGEFVSLIGRNIIDRRADALAVARELGCVVILKGHQTIITDGVTVYRNETGNPGMAVGGCGDVLAGLITSLIGQKMTALIAAACGVWLHGAAGDICAKNIGQYGMLPTDMLTVLPRLMK